MACLTLFLNRVRPHWTTPAQPVKSIWRLLSDIADSSSQNTSPPPQCRSAEDVGRLLSEMHNSGQPTKGVIVMAGAGLSTASGVPDFRSETGLYKNMDRYGKLPYPEAIFDLSFFQHNPRPFLQLAKDLYPGPSLRPNAGHYFFSLLEQKGVLRRVYTQNIDGLEREAGLPTSQLVEAHGTLRAAACIVCYEESDASDVRETILSGGTPRCKNCGGLVKPAIVFFGEALPERFFQLVRRDFTSECGLLLVLGTSLEVHPFAGVAEEADELNTQRVLINKDKVGTMGFRSTDLLLLGDLVERVSEVARAAGWEEDLKKLLQADKFQG